MQRAKDAGCEILFLDTAPNSDSAALQSAKLADLVLVPCRPAILDMEAISNTLDLVRTKSAPVFVVMNAVAPQGGEAQEAAEAIAGLDAPVCPVQLVSRVAFARSLITGHTAQEFEPNGKAAKEIEQLYAFMCTHLNNFHTDEKGDIQHVEQIRKRA